MLQCATWNCWPWLRPSARSSRRSAQHNGSKLNCCLLFSLLSGHNLMTECLPNDTELGHLRLIKARDHIYNHVLALLYLYSKQVALPWSPPWRRCGDGKVVSFFKRKVTNTGLKSFLEVAAACSDFWGDAAALDSRLNNNILKVVKTAN